jgi:butyrate kinase
LAILSYVIDNVSPEEMSPFSRTGEREISRQNKTFVLNIMKMDPRDRSTARELLKMYGSKESNIGEPS